MINNLRVALFQVDTLWEDIEGNLSMLENMFESMEHVDIVLLPEVFNTGFTPRARELAEDANGGMTLEWLVDMATKYNAAMCGTIFIKDGELYYNRLYFVRSNGDVEFYDKRHLFGLSFESKLLNPGNKQTIVEYNGWRLCFQICYDLRFPDCGRNEFVDNEYMYDIMINLANWPSSRTIQRDILMKARAIENQAFFIGVNRVGCDGNGWYYSGNSQVVKADGNYMIKSEINKKSVVVSELSYCELVDYRNSFPIARDW